MLRCWIPGTRTTAPGRSGNLGIGEAPEHCHPACDLHDGRQSEMWWGLWIYQESSRKERRLGRWIQAGEQGVKTDGEENPAGNPFSLVDLGSLSGGDPGGLRMSMSRGAGEGLGWGPAGVRLRAGWL